MMTNLEALKNMDNGLFWKRLNNFSQQLPEESRETLKDLVIEAFLNGVDLEAERWAEEAAGEDI